MISRPQYLLDANVVSETRKMRPQSRVLEFIDAAGPTAHCLSVLTLGEIRRGVAMKRLRHTSIHKLEDWVEELERSYADRILGIDAEVARLWGELLSGRSRPVIDTLLAATAIHHDLTLVTRNMRDVEGLPVKVVNPWELG